LLKIEPFFETYNSKLKNYNKFYKKNLLFFVHKYQYNITWPKVLLVIIHFVIILHFIPFFIIYLSYVTAQAGRNYSDLNRIHMSVFCHILLHLKCFTSKRYPIAYEFTTLFITAKWLHLRHNKIVTKWHHFKAFMHKMC
jgi:hypothetical protein